MGLVDANVHNNVHSLRMGEGLRPLPFVHCPDRNAAPLVCDACGPTRLRRMLSSMSDMVERLNAALEGRYAIERELGEGGMATVYLADDLKHERKVALKVLEPEPAAVVGAEQFRPSPYLGFTQPPSS